MSSVAMHPAEPEDVIGRGLSWLSRQFALAGGLILILLAGMTVVSIVGRTLFGTAVEGDYELVEMGLGMTIFLFLPECYLRQGHVVVDIFTSAASRRTRRLLALVSDLLFLALSLALVWQLYVGGMEAYDYEEQTMILSMPKWIVFVPGVASQVMMTLCSLYNVVGFFRGVDR